MSTAIDTTSIEAYLDAAKTHGEDSEPDHEVGDLQQYLRAAWAIMTPEQQAQFRADPEVAETYAVACG